MKKNVLHKKSNVAINRQSMTSGRQFVELRRAAVDKDLIAPTNTADRRHLVTKDMSLKDVELRYLDNCEKFVASNPTVEVLSNSSGSAMKSPVTLDGHHLNPLQQSKDSSARVVEYRHAFKDMDGLFNKAKIMPDLKNRMYTFEGDEIYAYSGVFNFANTDVGRLNIEVDDLNTMVSTSWKRLKDTHVRDGKKNRLMAVDGSYAAPVAFLVSNEFTINDEKLRNKDGKGIFNPHIHFLLFTDKELDSSVKDDLYKMWNDITGTKYKTDKQAFDFKPVYSKDDDFDENGKMIRRTEDEEKDISLVRSLKEVTKYLTDPGKWDLLALSEDDSDTMRNFKVELFAEYYNAYSNMKRVRTFGLLRDAVGFNNTFSDFKNASIFKGSDILGDLLTQLNEFEYDTQSKRYEFNHVRVLTDDELIHENKLYLTNILVSRDYKKFLNLVVDSVMDVLDTDKDRLYAAYFKTKTFNSSLQELYNMFESEREKITDELHDMHPDVFNPLSFKADYKKRYGEKFEFDRYEHFVLYRDLKLSVYSGKYMNQVMHSFELLGKLCDITLLDGAIQNLVDSDGRIEYSRAEIDSRIFSKRAEYRRAVNASSTDNVDIAFSNLFYRDNGMTLPFDGRTSETLYLYSDEITDAVEIFDLFRVPEESRARLSIELGFVKPSILYMDGVKEVSFITDEYTVGDIELYAEIQEHGSKIISEIDAESANYCPSRWGNPFEPLAYSKVVSVR